MNIKKARLKIRLAEKHKRLVRDIWEMILFTVILAEALFMAFYIMNGMESPKPIYGPFFVSTPKETPKTAPETEKRPLIIESNTRISYGDVEVTKSSPGVFAYAHGTASSDGRFFIGMENRSGNTFPINQVTVFTDPLRIERPVIFRTPKHEGIDTMVYDDKNDKIYFLSSSDSGLELFQMNPHTLTVTSLASTTIFSAGSKPAIVTDGKFVYGITNTRDSIIFKIDLKDGSMRYNGNNHIHSGHSASLAGYGSTTELYFAGGMSNEFEKVDGDTLDSLGSIKLGSCAMSDDMPFIRSTNGDDGYVYIGCEAYPYGFRIRTSSLETTRFPLPGESLGLFVHENTLYNTAQDGMLDIFPNGNIDEMIRYKISDPHNLIISHGMNLQPNELFFSSTTDMIYFTAWWGIPGLYGLPSPLKKAPAMSRQ